MTVMVACIESSHTLKVATAHISLSLMQPMHAFAVAWWLLMFGVCYVGGPVDVTVH